MQDKTLSQLADDADTAALLLRMELRAMKWTADSVACVLATFASQCNAPEGGPTRAAAACWDLAAHLRGENCSNLFIGALPTTEREPRTAAGSLD